MKIRLNSGAQCRPLRQRSQVLQQDNDPKHVLKSTQKWFKIKHWQKQLAKEEWSKIPIESCKKLTDGYMK